MEATLRRHLLALATAFAAADGISLSALSKRIFNDNTFFSRLSNGKNFTVKSFDKGVTWLAANWPESLPWPQGVPPIGDLIPADQEGEEAA